MTLPTKLVGIQGAAQDFLSALSDRPKIIRVILRFVFGEKAYHEFIFLANEYINDGMYMNYELDEMNYHSEKYRSDFSEGFKKY